MIFCKTVIVVITAAATVNAGGKTLNPKDSLPFLSMFQHLCKNQNPNSFDSPTDKSMFVYCKIWNGAQVPTKEINHNAEISARQQNKQVIFVQPPSARYIHNVSVSGNQNQQQHEVYVLPSQAKHEFRVQPPDIKIGTVKPALYFLTGGEDQSGNNQRPISPPGDVGTASVGPKDTQILPGSVSRAPINHFRRASTLFSGTTNPNKIGEQPTATFGGYGSARQVGLHSGRNPPAPEVLFLNR